MRIAPILALLLSTGASGVALAQAVPADLGGRVTKLEKEVRAVQRKVFPGADPAYFDAEITPAAPAPTGGTPATSPITDLTSRVDALERQLTTMTATSEQNQFQLRQLQDQLSKVKADTEFRLNTLEGKSPAAAPAPANAAPSTPPPIATPAAPRPARIPSRAPATPAPSAAADPAEDDYSAAYQFVREGKYAEAAPALKAYVTKYPKAKRTSYAQHWLGRSYLAEGKPALAAEAFYANYQNMPRGDRAPDSLYWLGQSLVQLKKPTEACRVYNELTDVYGAKMAPQLKDQTAKARVAASCGK